MEEKPKSKPAVLKAMRKYVHSEVGKQTRKEYVKLHRKERAEYNKKYQKDARARCKRLGYCYVCKKRPGKLKKYLADDGTWKTRRLTICEVCSEMNKKHSKKWRGKDEQQKTGFHTEKLY
jgi:hypothetical protein